MSKNGVKPRRRGPGRLTGRQSQLVKGIAAGKTMKAAAKAAGYSDSTASHPGDVLDRPAVHEQLVKLLPPITKLAKRISEGVDAKRTVFANFEGQITDSRDCIDFEQRRKYVELALNVSGVPVTQRPGQPLVNVGPIQVVIRAIGSDPRPAATSPSESDP
jgi:hypothetical protein